MAENPIFSYTKRDYESSRKEGLAKIPLLSNGRWTDLNATDPGVIILDYVHALVDQINYYQDHQALESFITTAKERANIFRLAKQLSYKIRSSKGANCIVVFKLSSSDVLDHILKIPKHTIVSTSKELTYLTTEDVYLPAGSTEVSALCTQGTLNNITYTGTGISRFSNLEGAANQSLRISSRNIDVDSIVIKNKITGELWNPVDYIIFSTELDKVYQVELNPDDTVTIKFGDGERGVVPSTEDILSIDYITTLAEEGRTDAGTISKVVSNILDNSTPVAITVYNPKASTEGSTSQSSRDIRELAPGAIKAQDRAVTLKDFENLAKLVEGVRDARADDINTDSTISNNVVRLLIIPEDISGDFNLLKDKVSSYISQRMIPPTTLEISAPDYKGVTIDIHLQKLENMDETTLTYAIEEAVKKYFDSREGAIGRSLYVSEISSVLYDIEGIRTLKYVTATSITESEALAISASHNQIITLSKTTLHIQ